MNFFERKTMLNILKKILSFSWVKKRLSPKKILIILTGVGAIILLVKWYKKRKEAQAQEKQEVKKITSSSLVNIWREFIRRIPREYRHAIPLYQPFVVLGEAGSGKSLLIEKYTDWKGQSYQFYPSYTEDSQMQIYLGSQVLVQEIPADILNDTSREARVALVNLWNSSFHKRDPIIVVTLKADNLATMTPDALRRQSKMLRGKINIISQMYKNRIPVKIVLTHIDRIEGFQEFARFLQANDIPLKINLNQLSLENDLKKCLENYEIHLPLALTTMNSLEYKYLIKFLQQIPETFSATALFLQSLTEKDPLAPSVSLDELYLESNTNKEKLANPFATSWPQEILSSLDSASFRHRVIRISLLILGTALLIFAYLYERNHWDKAQKNLAVLFQAPTYSLCESSNQEISNLSNKETCNYLRIFHNPFAQNYQQRLEKQYILGVRNFYVVEWNKAQAIVEKFSKEPSNELYNKARPMIEELVNINKVKFLAPSLKDFSESYEKSIKEQFVAAIRNFYLIPLLQKCALSSNAHEKTLYLLSVIYASKENELGKQTLGNIAQWSKNLDIPEKVIQDYVMYTEVPWNEPVPLIELPSTKKDFDAADNPEPWITYFIEINNILQRPYITSEYLEKIKQEGKPLVEVIYYVGQYSLAQTLFDTLERETRLNVRKVYKPLAMTKWISKNNEMLKILFQFINEASLAIPSVEKYSNLPQFIVNLKTFTSLEAPQKILEFDLEGKRFQFSAEKWHNLIQNSKIIKLSDMFMQYNQERKDVILFSGRNIYESIFFNRYNDGINLFIGQKEIPGKYTREAYEREVKIVLQEFDEVIKSLPLPRNKKNELTNFIFERAKHYAFSYYKSYEDYYNTFDIQVESVISLEIILTQMQLPSSPFMDFLRTITENTALETGNCPYLIPLKEHLAAFKPIHQLINNPENNELQTYKIILQGIKEQLHNIPKNKKDDKKKKDGKDSGEAEFEEFAAVLSPVGRLTLFILLQEKDSYLSITQDWLRNVKIRGEWQKPFLAPIAQLYDLGILDMEYALKKNWETKVYSILAPLVNKFPFNTKSQRDVSPIDFETALHPNSGTFWKTFQQFIAPACIKQDGLWKLRESLRKPIEAPKNMFETVNFMQTLSQTLWDEDGNPRPLKLEVQATPLPLPSYDKSRYATLSSLTVGKTACFNFNQQPSWKQFPVSWWKQETSKVALEYTVPANGQKYEYSIVINDSLWSFFKLLQKSKMVEQDIYTWYLPENASDYTSSKVKFSFSENPWRLFQLSTALKAIPEEDIPVENLTPKENISEEAISEENFSEIPAASIPTLPNGSVKKE